MLGSRLRATAVLAAGALALHQLRYLFGHGREAGMALAREGHAYFELVAPLVAVLLGAALLQLMLALVSRRGGRRPASAAPLGRRWIALALALLAVYVVQESLEGVLCAAHPGGIAALVGDGGWIVVPLAAAIGLLSALLLRGAEAALGRASAPPSLATARAGVHSARLVATDPPRLSVIGLHLAGRAPPLAAR
jgi:hypothetical protein